MTHSSLRSGVTTKRRGRVPTTMFFTTWPPSASIMCTMSATSEVT